MTASRFVSTGLHQSEKRNNHHHRQWHQHEQWCTNSTDTNSVPICISDLGWVLCHSKSPPHSPEGEWNGMEFPTKPTLLATCGHQDSLGLGSWLRLLWVTTHSATRITIFENSHRVLLCRFLNRSIPQCHAKKPFPQPILPPRTFLDAKNLFHNAWCLDIKYYCCFTSAQHQLVDAQIPFLDPSTQSLMPVSLFRYC